MSGPVGVQRIRAVLYHHGIAGAPDDLRTLAGREFLAGLKLPVDATERIAVALEIIDVLEIQIAGHAMRTGDVSRLHASRQAVRIAGIDIGVHRCDPHARLGKLTRQGSAQLRWALYEAAQSACRATSPDYQYHHALKDRGLTHTRASLTIARKIARRSYHILRELGPAALDPIGD